jgi:hypothetical protein
MIEGIYKTLLLGSKNQLWEALPKPPCNMCEKNTHRGAICKKPKQRGFELCTQ